jgi:hypothetical protein
MALKIVLLLQLNGNSDSTALNTYHQHRPSSQQQHPATAASGMSLSQTMMGPDTLINRAFQEGSLEVMQQQRTKSPDVIPRRTAAEAAYAAAVAGEQQLGNNGERDSCYSMATQSFGVLEATSHEYRININSGKVEIRGIIIDFSKSVLSTLC